MSGWSKFEVAGRLVEVFAPVETPSGVVIWLHGFDEESFRGRAAFEEAFANQGLLVACPAGGAGWWLDLPMTDFIPDLTPAQLVVDHLPRWIEEQWSVAPPRIALGGIGMGGQGAINLGFRHARRFPVVAAISPDIDFQQWHGSGTVLDQWFPSAEAARQQTATLHLHPLNWPRHLLMVCDPDDAGCIRGTERLASKMISSGVPFESALDVRAGGHTWEYFERMIPRVAGFLGESVRSVANALPRGNS